MKWIPIAISAWLGIAVFIAACWGRAHRRPPQKAAWEALAPEPELSADDTAFALLIPDFATDELLAGLKLMDRKYAR